MHGQVDARHLRLPRRHLLLQGLKKGNALSSTIIVQPRHVEYTTHTTWSFNKRILSKAATSKNFQLFSCFPEYKEIKKDHTIMFIYATGYTPWIPVKPIGRRINKPTGEGGILGRRSRYCRVPGGGGLSRDGPRPPPCLDTPRWSPPPVPPRP